jgi:hypothetical protein
VSREPAAGPRPTARSPRDQRDRIERMDELYGFLEQSNISRKNIARLEILVQHT